MDTIKRTENKMNAIKKVREMMRRDFTNPKNIKEYMEICSKRHKFIYGTTLDTTSPEAFLRNFEGVSRFLIL